MRSEYKIVICSAALLAAACSKSVMPEAPSAMPQEEWVNNESLLVPISFGQDNYSIISKAAITPETVEGTQFGIYGVDLGTDEEWGADVKSVLMYNKVGQYTVADGKSTIQFVDETGAPASYYYPLVTENNFTFYGYHTSNSLITEDPAAQNGYWEGDAFYTDVKLGSVDVLWAKASAHDISGKDENGEDMTVQGFNASYSRWSRKWYPDSYSDHEPSFTFSHLTSALHFYAVAEDADAEATLDGKLSIYNLYIKNLPAVARLCIADKSGEEEGTLAAVGDNDTLYMYNGADYLNLSVYPKAGAGAEIGEGLFILPQSAEGMTVNFNLLNPDGSLYLVTRDLPKPANGVFEAGKSYEFKIIVKSIEEIVIQAIVKSWEPGFVADGDNTVDILG